MPLKLRPAVPDTNSPENYADTFYRYANMWEKNPDIREVIGKAIDRLLDTYLERYPMENP